MKVGSLTISVDAVAQAIYIYLRPTKGFRSYRQEEPRKGVIVDFDAEGRVIGVELLGPGRLDLVVKQLIPKYHIPALRQVLARQEAIEEQLAGSRGLELLHRIDKMEKR